jgi:hypothetical protein
MFFNAEDFVTSDLFFDPFINILYKDKRVLRAKTDYKKLQKTDLQIDE